MIIRPLTTIAEFRRCIELQREAFGWADIDLLPVRVLVVLGHIGGLVLGAYDGEILAAFVNAMPGIRNGSAYWHSHMLAVSKPYWNSGVGHQLKRAQREFALDRGIRLIEWTFDPMESKNAYLNIAKLGTIVRRYYPNHYGETTGALQRGMDSDRVIAEWWVDRPPVPIEGEVRRVAIPAELQSLKQRSIQQARDIQKNVREQFLANIRDGFFAAGFERGDEWSSYVFVKGASGVDPSD